MSSVSGDIISTTENNFISEYPSSIVVSSLPTTESLEIQSPNQDGCLKSQENSSKVVVVLPIISSDLSSEQHNGSLRDLQESPDLSIPINPSSKSREQNGSSLNKARFASSGVKRTCRFYEKNGFCRYGNNCRYGHSESDRPKYVQRYSYVEENVRGNSSSDDFNVLEKAPDGFNVVEKAPDDFGNPNNVQKELFVCKFFSRKGFCRYGESCRFAHQSPPLEIAQVPEVRKRPDIETTLKNVSEDKQHKSSGLLEDGSLLDGSAPVRLKSNKVCHLFYRYGECRFGESCKYRHKRPKPKKDINTSTVDKENSESTKNDNIDALKDVKVNKNEEDAIKLEGETKSDQNEEVQGQTNCNAPKPVLLRNKKRSDMTEADFLKLRNIEITQLKRKFPKSTETFLPDVGTVFNLDFHPTDPDWRFDVKSVNINVMIPETYPEENLQVDLQNEEGILPDKLVRFFNKSTFTWLQDEQENNKVADEVQLIFRPFIKWLDKSLEDIFISGLKMVKRDMEARAAGLEFVTHEELTTNNQSKKDAEPENDPLPTEDYPSLFAEYEDPVPQYMGEDMNSQSVLMENVVDHRSVTETPKRGTEIKLRNLELLEAAASLTCSKLSVTVQCGRCKMRSDVSVGPHRSHRIVCERCHHQQKLVFRPQMLHQFSSVAGYLDLDNCEVIDVPFLTCEFAIQCLPCGRQNFLSGVQYGQPHTTWCLFCHSKMAVSVESVKLNQLQPNVETITAKAGQLLKLEKKEKRVKDPAVQEGKPLPENGTCKHYKKSFRWLRFPCCGKTYPCDHCHDEKETDHEMKFATRMLCGFCAKEQPYSKDRPCTSCASDMTKKIGTHWEGGKGCRDKVKMSRDDKQKYAGTNKTVSQKKVGSAVKK